MQPQNAFYAQSGGVTAVINASACGLLEAARAQNWQIGKILAGRNGILGALHEDLIDTSLESNTQIAALRYTPSGAFGSCRYKLESPQTHPREFERLLAVFAAHDIGYFFYNGGGDSADTCLKVSQYAQARGFPLQSIHIPKTIDNDLPLTDNCPGFGSAAKYVAVSALEATLDVRSMYATSTKVFVLEVMGRHTGWIAAAAGLIEDYGLPVLLLLPEVIFDPDAFLRALSQKVAQHGYCTVAVSEGTRRQDGSFLAEQENKDAFGHAQLGGAAPVIAQLIERSSGSKIHWAVADYLQRAARHIASKTDVDQAYALGQGALESALGGADAVMLGVERLSNTPYAWRIKPEPLERIANIEKTMPQSFLSKTGFGITQAYKDYLYPLLEGEDYPPYTQGLPQYATLQNQPVPKRLAAFETIDLAPAQGL